MGQQHPAEVGVGQLGGQLGRRPVGEVAAAAPDAVLHRPGIGALAEHDFVVVGLEHQEVAAGQGVLHRRRGPPEVGGEAELEPGLHVEDGHRQGVGRVVAGEEGPELQPAEPERVAGLEDLDLLLPPQQVPARLQRGGAHVEGPSPAPGRHAHARGVVPVLVGDDHGPDRGGVDAQPLEAERDLAAAEAGVHEHPGRPRLDEDGVPVAAAPQARDLHGAPPSRRPRASSHTAESHSRAPGPISTSRRPMTVPAVSRKASFR